MKKYLFPVLILFLFVVPAFAQDDAASASLARVQAPKVDDFPVLKKIAAMADKNAGVEYDYLGKESDVEIWLISGDRIMEMVHVLPSGAAIMGGTFISSDGKELSSAIQKKFAADHPDRAQKIIARVRASMGKDDVAQVPQQNQPQATTPAPTDKVGTAEMIWAHMDKLGLVRYGADKDAPVVYLVIDPTQAASVEAFKKLEPFAENKKIDLRVVPIAISSEQALMDIALILPRQSAAQDLKDLMEGKRPVSKEPPNPDGGLLLKNTADFVEAMRLNALPSLFYRHSISEPIRAVKGPPKDWAPVLKELDVE